MNPDTSPLDLLRAGRIDLEAYVRAKIDEALASYQLPPPYLERIRQRIRVRLALDPDARRLVALVTGVQLPAVSFRPTVRPRIGFGRVPRPSPP